MTVGFGEFASVDADVRWNWMPSLGVYEMAAGSAQEMAGQWSQGNVHFDVASAELVNNSGKLDDPRRSPLRARSLFHFHSQYGQPHLLQLPADQKK
jgi:hypothetical protein